MTLEVLFAQAGQGRAFLMMVLAGALSALLIHLTAGLHHLGRGAGLAGDALCAMLLALIIGQAALWGGGLRLYGLLGLLIGLALYLAGVVPPARAVKRLLQKSFANREE